MQLPTSGGLPDETAYFCVTSPKHILFVDDSEDSRFLIGRVLKQSFPEAEIILARDGAEALMVLERSPVDAIVTDNRMVEMSGLELTRQIRATGSRVPILMLTGSDELEQEALQAGVTVFHPSSQWTSVGEALHRCWNRHAEW